MNGCGGGRSIGHKPPGFAARFDLAQFSLVSSCRDEGCLQYKGSYCLCGRASKWMVFVCVFINGKGRDVVTEYGRTFRDRCFCSVIDNGPSK